MHRNRNLAVYIYIYVIRTNHLLRSAGVWQAAHAHNDLSSTFRGVPSQERLRFTTTTCTTTTITTTTTTTTATNWHDYCELRAFSASRHTAPQSLRLPQDIIFVLLPVISLLCRLLPSKFLRTSSFLCDRPTRRHGTHC